MKNRKFFDCGRLDGKNNLRVELRDRCIPNVIINNLTINVPDNVPDVTLMYFRTVSESQYVGNMNYMDKFIINGLTFHYDTPYRAPANFYLSNIELPLQDSTVVTIHNLDLLGNAVITKKNSGLLISNLKKQSKSITLGPGEIRAAAIK